MRVFEYTGADGMIRRIYWHDESENMVHAQIFFQPQDLLKPQYLQLPMKMLHAFATRVTQTSLRDQLPIELQKKLGAKTEKVVSALATLDQETQAILIEALNK